VSSIAQRILDPVARAFGYRFLPKHDVKYQQEIDLLRRLLGRFKVDTVLDVGANRGQYHDLLRGPAGFGGRVVSVEPVPELVQHLRQRATGDRQWEIRDCALGEAVGRASFNVMSGDVFSSFLSPDAAATSPYGRENTVARTVDVAVDTLDRLVPELEQARRIDSLYLKLDTQGFDLKVLGGGRGVLERVVALQTELSFVPLYQDMPGWIDTVRYLEDAGFRLSGFSPIAPTTQFPVALEMNGFFVNSRFV
jgi:FkbM family methyltransferase